MVLLKYSIMLQKESETQSVKVIIFSFDRAMQLSSLLESIIKHDCRNVFNISVIYAFSSELYEKGYQKLQQVYKQIDWINERNFKKSRWNFSFDLKYWHNWYWWYKYRSLRKNKSGFKSIVIDTIERSTENFLMFLTDDSLFMNEIIIPSNCMELITQNPQDYSFSLRHGENIKDGQYTKKENFIHWNVYLNDIKTDWGYPFSVDGHIYFKQTLMKLLKKIIYNNPNTMEGNIASYIKGRRLFPHIIASFKSVLIGSELNRVQSIVDNNNLGISQEMLNKFFLQGYFLYIDFEEKDKIDFRPLINTVYLSNGREKIVVYDLKENHGKA